MAKDSWALKKHQRQQIKKPLPNSRSPKAETASSPV